MAETKVKVNIVMVGRFSSADQVFMWVMWSQDGVYDKRFALADRGYLNTCMDLGCSDESYVQRTKSLATTIRAR